MNLSEVMMKIARNESLNPQELSFLEIQSRETQLRNSFVGDNTTADGKLNVRFPFYPIFSETFSTDKASLTVQIPSGFKHLMIIGQGRISAANGGNVWCQFNGDIGSNYAWTILSGNGSTAGSAEDTSDTHAALGLFSNTGDPVGSSSSFDAKIMNYISAYHQQIISTTYFNDNTTRTVYLLGSKWLNANIINSIEIYATDNTITKGTANMLAGSVISIYGMA